MEVDNNGKAESSGGRPVVAGAGTQTSVSVAMHPLVVMNISEHWTRTNAQHSAQDGNANVVGALLGKQRGRELELMNSFELLFDTVGGVIVIDREFLKTREAQYKEVFTELEFLGWYTTGDAPSLSDVDVHKPIWEINESPIFLKLDPKAKPSEKLPMQVFESVIDLVEGEACLLFVELSYHLVTEEAERIGVDHVARISASSSSPSSSVSKQLWAQHGAVKMLSSRLHLILDYLSAVESGELPKNDEVLREIGSLCCRLPVVNSEGFQQEFNNQCNDISLMAYLGALSKTCGSLNQLVNKLNVMHDRHGPGSMRRARGLGGFSIWR